MAWSGVAFARGMLALSNVTIAGLRSVRFDSKGNDGACVGKLGATAECHSKYLDVFYQVVRRHHEHHRVFGSRPFRYLWDHERCQRECRRSVASDGLQSDGRRPDSELPRVLSGQESMLLVADDDRGANIRYAVDARQRLLQKRAVTHQGEKLLWIKLP